MGAKIKALVRMGKSGEFGGERAEFEVSRISRGLA